MTWDDLVPLWTLLTSLIAAAVIFLLPEDRVRTRTAVNMAAAALKLVLIGVMLGGVYHGRRYAFRMPVLPDAPLVLRADALAVFFVTLSGVLWFFTTIYAIAYLEGSPHRRRFFGFFSLCVSATIGIALSGNLFTFVIFYELLTLSTYPLVVHRETPAALRAGRIYLVYTLSGGAVLLLAAVWLHVLVPSGAFDGGAAVSRLGLEHRGTLRLLFGLLITGLGVKAALVPLHVWLPRAMVAPAPVSALLHAVAVVKAGAFGIVRVVYDVYGIDFAHALGLTPALAVLASVTILYGSFRALVQDDLKRRLAYSTVSQVAYIALGVGVFGPSSTVGGVVHLVHQGLMKITLFFGAGNLAETHGLHKISELDGVGRRMPWTMAAFTVGAFGMIGLPPMAGFVSKWYLGTGAIEASAKWVLWVLAASSALNAAYFLPIVYRAWFREPSSAGPPDACSGPGEARWGLLLPTLVTAVLTITSGLLAGTPLSPLQWAAMIVERNYGRTVLVQGAVEQPAAMSLPGLMLLASIVVPLLAAGLSLWGRTSPFARWGAGLAAVPGLLLACLGDTGARLDLSWVLLHLHLELDETGRAFLLFTALLWAAAGMFAAGSLAVDRRAPRFFAYFLLAMSGNVGLVLSRDMASFYLFFALMSFSSYGLIVHYGDAEAVRAGRVYMILAVTGEVALLLGMLLAASARQSLLFDQGLSGLASSPDGPLILGALLAGFGIKAGIVPLHAWLPLAHPAAPTPASAVLSGAMIKAGVLGWMRFLPVGEAAFGEWGAACLALGLATALYAALIGALQPNPKVVLAYSSVSQMGLLLLGTGAALLVPEGWPALSAAIAFYALHHGLSKGCLFLSVGVDARSAGGGWRLGVHRAGVLLPALAMAGLPLTSGALAKSSLKSGLSALPPGWADAVGLLLPLTTVGTTLLMARFIYLVWPRREQAARRPSSAVVASWGALVVLLAAAGWWAPAIVSPGAGKSLAETVAWDNLWPIALGAALAGGACRWPRGSAIRERLAVRPGDLLWPAANAAQSLSACLFPWFAVARRTLSRRETTIRKGRTAHASATSRLVAAEALLANWQGVGVLLLVLLSLWWIVA